MLSKRLVNNNNNYCRSRLRKVDHTSTHAHEEGGACKRGTYIDA